MKPEYRSISRQDVIQAIEVLKTGKKTRWGPSKKFYLVYEGGRFAPKAVLGLAICNSLGIQEWSVREFNGGEPTNAVLRRLGFDIELKHCLSK
jgi:hypothetical protein